MLTFYRHHCSEHGLEGASEATIINTWKPLMLGQVTSALGLISLLTSDLLPIRKFGFYSALGTLATLGVMYLYLPAALQLWPPGYHKRRIGQATPLEEWVHNFSKNFWNWLAGGIVRNHYWLAPSVFVFVCIMGYGATKLKTNVHLLKMFDANSKIIRDYAWMENNLGRLVPMEMVVRVAPKVTAPLSTSEADETEGEKPAAAKTELNQFSFLERMELADHVQRAVEEEFGPAGQNILGRGMSAVTFAPPLPEPGFGWRNSRGVMNRKLEQHRDEFLTSDYLRIDKDPKHVGSELWRVSLRLGALNDVDYGEFVNDLKCVVEPVMSAIRHREAVLNRLVELRGEQALTGARVAVVGVSDPAVLAKSAEGDAPQGQLAEQIKIRPVAATATDNPNKNADKLRAYSANQERLFARTMHDLLENRGFKTSATAKTKLDFIDLAAVGPGGTLTADKLTAKLAGYDCVVLAKEIDGCNLALLEKHAKHVIDARDFQFNPFIDQPTSSHLQDNVHTIYTGVVPVVYKAQRSLLDSLVESTKYAFVSIAACMMVLLRRGKLSIFNLLNIRAGFVAMLPNIFPLVVVFGALGYLGIEVDIGSMMTASIALGVAVDDTIHYLAYFRNSMKSGLSRREAIIAGYQHSGSAIIETM
ncbi:MAG TPA: hypothetical protein VL096_14225, partial [Pirellulaceae bacterium]|nr:hypothetical protein [Pirellulaceae bacterium]